MDSLHYCYSACRCLLTVLCHRRSTLGHRAFSVAGPTVWNLLPDQLRDSDCTESTFRQSLKTFFFNSVLACCSALEVFMIMRYINLHFTLLLTYFCRITYLNSLPEQMGLKPRTVTKPFQLGLYQIFYSDQTAGQINSHCHYYKQLPQQQPVPCCIDTCSCIMHKLQHWQSCYVGSLSSQKQAYTCRASCHSHRYHNDGHDHAELLSAVEQWTIM